jgi:hypothetical protein
VERRFRGSGWAAIAVVMLGPLGAGNQGCGGRQTAHEVQGNAAASGAGASGAGNGSSTGSGSTTGDTGSIGTSGSGTGSGAAPDSGSAGTGSTQPASGSATGTFSGSATGTFGGSAVDAAAPPRCGFSPDPGATSQGPTASAMVILSRIYQFLDDSAVVPPGAVLSQPTATWAGVQAMAILDGHLANATAAPGLLRFLTAWLKIALTDGGPSAARTWSLRLLDPSATLTTLLAGPTGDPHRIGVLTDPQVLMARPGISARGRWMVENLLSCSAVPTPPANTPMTSPPPMPGQTRREELVSELANPVCSVCHSLMDPPGLSLEHFDEMGSYRDLDNGKPVDSSGILYGSPAMLAFTSIDDLAPRLAVACPVAQCFAKIVMNDAFGFHPTSTNVPFTAEEANHVANAFANSNFSIRELVMAIVATPSFLR